MIIATAGHVDHGKTSLVKQLTGVNTDTLEEEQRRGLSINLGFAYHYFGDNQCLGFIDVPGHTRFINTMISGVRGIDLGLLIIAADDGVMPQTREHLAVLKLLGVASFAIVVTKIDLVDQILTDNVTAEAAALLSEFGVSDAPVYAVSNQTAQGVGKLRSALEQMGASLVAEGDSGNFRMSVDRAFNLKGTGLVVTGTVTAGCVAVGDSLDWSLAGMPSRVRGIHVQDRPGEQGHTGDRCALNLSGGPEIARIQRGDWLQGEGGAPTTQRSDVKIELLPDAACSIRQLTPVSVYIDARQVRARVYLLGIDSDTDSGKSPRVVNPGETCLAQLIFFEPVLVSAAQRLLLRDDSQVHTLGGGIVIDPYAPQWKKARAARRAYLGAMQTGNLKDMLEHWLMVEEQCIDEQRVRHSWNLRPDEMTTLLTEPVFDGRIDRVADGDREYLVSKSTWHKTRGDMLSALNSWQTEHKAQAGIEVDSFKTTLGTSLLSPLIDPALGQLVQAREIEIKNGVISLVGHCASMPPELQADWTKIEGMLKHSGVKVPLLSEVCAATAIQPRELVNILRQATVTGAVLRVSEKRFALRGTVAILAQAFLDLAHSSSEVPVVAYRDRLQIGRNFAIEVLEYFDKVGFTLRRGNVRIVRDAQVPVERFGLLQ